ncbi:hypothetical protein HYC85_004145 [Camellia sinensis]|uniref:Uncharacterized protein n=1 Tax=Camellia sinensis TaxID=4442 RepID=A0A7J7HVN9_CAMSI|nr:hypothetical protein HYC85_004145 [Camellia sinensis]
MTFIPRLKATHPTKGKTHLAATNNRLKLKSGARLPQYNTLDKLIVNNFRPIHQNPCKSKFIFPVRGRKAAKGTVAARTLKHSNTRMSWTARYTQRERENYARATHLHHPQCTALEEQKPYQHQETRHKLHPHLMPDRQTYRLAAKLRRSSFWSSGKMHRCLFLRYNSDNTQPKRFLSSHKKP